MTFDYARMAGTATRLLTQFGQTVTRRIYTNGTYDPDTGTTTPTTADVSRIAAVFPVKSGITTIRGALVQVGDLEMLLDPDGAVEITDRYILEARNSASWFNYFFGDVAAQEFTVVSYERLAPAGTPVLYTLHLRQA